MEKRVSVSITTWDEAHWHTAWVALISGGPGDERTEATAAAHMRPIDTIGGRR